MRKTISTYTDAREAAILRYTTAAADIALLLNLLDQASDDIPAASRTAALDATDYSGTPCADFLSRTSEDYSLAELRPLLERKYHLGPYSNASPRCW